MKLRHRIKVYVLLAALFSMTSLTSSAQQSGDTSSVLLKKVTIIKTRPSTDFHSVIPAQTISDKLVRQLNVTSVGDVAKYFSGVLVKDYGGKGGLKTVSIRGLGAVNTGIVYDGIPVSDVQSGQIDLSKFPTLFLKTLSVYQGNPLNLLQPARSFASSSLMEIQTNTFHPEEWQRLNWRGDFGYGSFGFFQTGAGVYAPIGKHLILSIEGEALFSKGNYPYKIVNGNLTEKARRGNTKTRSQVGEINVFKLFKDSSTLQVKTRGYNANRQLPGAIIFFNPRSAQTLDDNETLIQSRYRKEFNKKTALLLSAKYSRNYTRYTDPDFQNGQGGIDDRYYQDEYDASSSASLVITPGLSGSVAADIAYNHLKSNKSQLDNPRRLSLWNSLMIKYEAGRWQIAGNLLNTYFHDDTRHQNVDKKDNDRVTPTLSAGFKPSPFSPFLFRMFYKNIFRMPTFNDLYYNLIGNRNLKPESTDQYNIGITWSKQLTAAIDHLSLSADGYFNRVTDKILAVPSQNLFNWSMMNLGRVRIAGVDINAESAFHVNPEINFFVRLANTLQHAVDVTDPASATYKNKIPYTPTYSGSGLLQTNFKKWSLTYSILFSGRRYALGANDKSNELDGWMTHDVALSRSVRFRSVGMVVKGEANNLTNQFYDVVRYFPMPGRNFKISIIFKNQ